MPSPGRAQAHSSNGIQLHACSFTDQVTLNKGAQLLRPQFPCVDEKDCTKLLSAQNRTWCLPSASWGAAHGTYSLQCFNSVLTITAAPITPTQCSSCMCSLHTHTYTHLSQCCASWGNVPPLSCETLKSEMHVPVCDKL